MVSLVQWPSGKAGGHFKEKEIMKNLITRIKDKFKLARYKLTVDSKLMDFSDYKSVEPEKFRKTLEFATVFYKDNKIAREFIKRESTAYWEVIDYLRYSSLEDSIFKRALEK